MMTETLCWKCANIIKDGCEWAKENKPVPGWEAKKTILLVSQGQRVNSYCVIKCPKFRRFREDET